MHNSGEIVISIWLTPCENDKSILGTIITDLAYRYSTPAFAPHLTLTTGSTESLSSVQSHLETTACRFEPFSLHIKNIECSEYYFKSLFLTFESSAALNRLHADIRLGIGEKPGYEFLPHLSLLYKDMPLAGKRILAGNMSVPLDAVTFDSMRLTLPGNAQAGWYDVAGWRTAEPVKLHGKRL